MNRPTNEVIFHVVKDELPEENVSVLWWYKGDGCPPYCGSMCDCDFPEIDDFFAWCEIPNPTMEFWEEYNPYAADRESGYYWIILQEGDDPRIAEYKAITSIWYICGEEDEYQDYEFFNINENRLTASATDTGKK